MANKLSNPENSISVVSDLPEKKSLKRASKEKFSKARTPIIKKTKEQTDHIFNQLTFEQIQKKSPLFLRRAELTKKWAQREGVDQLTPKFIKLLDQKLQKLFWSRDNFFLSEKEFDQLCTKKRVECVREMYLEMSGEEFNRRFKKHKFKNIWYSLRFPEYKKEGFWREDSQFFIEKCIPLIKKSALYASGKYKLPQRAIADLAEEILWHESKGDPFAVSTTEHLGIGQLGSALFTGRDSRYRKKVNPFNIVEAIPRAVDYIARNFEAFSQNKQLAMQAYNAGPGAVHRRHKKTLSFEAQKYPKAVEESHARLKFLSALQRSSADL